MFNSEQREVFSYLPPHVYIKIMGGKKRKKSILIKSIQTMTLVINQLTPVQ
jgi:hypothetical protein